MWRVPGDADFLETFDLDLRHRQAPFDAGVGIAVLRDPRGTFLTVS